MLSLTPSDQNTRLLMRQPVTSLFLAAAFAAAAASGEDPVLLVEDFYTGSVSEQGGLVEVVPGIQAKNGPICGFRIVSAHKGEVPFEVFMLDQEAGTAQLKARHPLNCEEKRRHVVSLAAVSCSGAISESADVHITVKDVNEFIPEWSQEEYSGEVEEGEIAEVILQVVAEDQDCSPTFGEVCSYSITAPDQPFSVSPGGVIRNRVPLSASESRSHVLSVVAVDCGGKESSPVLVTITVTPSCSTAWSDVSTSMTYIPGTGPQPVFPAAHLSLCPAMCPVSHLETTLSLHTDHSGGGCHRDTYSLQNQRKMCGASNQAVELLPAQSDSSSWVNELNRDKGREAGPVYEFSGGRGVTVPEATLGHNLGPEFTISTWMKHEARAADKHGKEQILCVADDHRKSRHHASLFIRNCKLVLLLRRDYREDERNVFKPAEWRWSVPQVCDDRWHHYAVSVSPEGAELYLDGELWQSQQNNPEIIDDWPLHPAADLKTTLTVGGCWHGSDMKMRHVLRGYLAGLSVLVGRREHSEVLKCLVQCSESLQLPATNLLEPGMEMVTNSHGTQVTIDGDNVDNMNTLVRQVAYLNTREFPVPGKRRLEISTLVTCRDGSERRVPSTVSVVNVMTVPQPILTLSGSDNVSKEYEEFKAGVRIFSDLKISVSQTSGRGESGASVDQCRVSVFPPLNPDHERIQLPESMMQSLNLAGSLGPGGGLAEIKGADMIYNYEGVLRQVTYTNLKPAYYLNRQFKIVCSELNFRFTSNEYIQTLTVVHPAPAERVPEARPAHHLVSHHTAELAQAVRAEYYGGGGALGGPGGVASSGGGVVVGVVVVSVCVLLGVLVLGVLRLRASHNRQLREEQEVEMAWDDAALNITVNPLEDTAEASRVSRGGHKIIESDLYQDSSDEEMYEESSEEDEDEESEHQNRLEWDEGL